MKIGIISDAHLFHKYSTSPEMYSDIIINNFKDVDFIVDCGDITDKYTITAPQLNSLFNTFSAINKPFYIVAGNHDSLDKTTVASILKLNNNIKVISEPTQIDDFLFVPYTNNIQSLYKNLNNIVTRQARIMFSHLTITDNVYADIHYKNLNKLFKYANVIVNGHIHQDDYVSTIYGDFYNIGSCSSLTYGDNHIPCYSIYDLDKNKNERFNIKNSIIHCSYILKQEQDVDIILNDIQDKVKDYKLCCKISLSNTDKNIENRKRISTKLKNNDRIVNVTYSYTNNQNNSKKNIKSVLVKNELSIGEQFIQLFENKNNTKIDKEVKDYLL